MHSSPSVRVGIHPKLSSPQFLEISLQMVQFLFPPPSHLPPQGNLRGFFSCMTLSSGNDTASAIDLTLIDQLFGYREGFAQTNSSMKRCQILAKCRTQLEATKSSDPLPMSPAIAK